MAKRVSVPLCALLLSACGPAVSSAPVLSRAPRPADHEIRLYSTRLPACPYEEVGLIQAKRRNLGMIGHSSLESVIDSVRQRARAMGGDAVILLGQSQTIDGATVLSGPLSHGATTWFGGAVIRFTEATCSEQDV